MDLLNVLHVFERVTNSGRVKFWMVFGMEPKHDTCAAYTGGIYVTRMMVNMSPSSSSHSKNISTATIHKHGNHRWKGNLCTYANSVLTFLVAASLLPASTTAEDSGIEYEDYVMMASTSCVNKHANVSLEGDYCEPLFEGFCWPPTEVGKTITFDCEAELHSVSRTCLENGMWENQTFEEMLYQCNKHSLLNIKLSLPCVLFSLIACIAAFFILACSRTLWCKRNYIHWHLISSFGLKYVFLFIQLFLFIVLGVALPPIAKIMFFVIIMYLEMTNFFWMFVEGLYLHTLVAFAFRFDLDQIQFYWYCIIGWGTPLFFSVIYVIVAISTGFDESVTDLALKVLVVLPITTILVLNSIFLLNIVRILMSKLRESSGDTQLKHYRRTARATLLLVILLGISYVFPLFIMNLMKGLLDNMVIVVIMYLNTILAGLQGFLVSLIYVFMNSEVKAVLSRKWERLFGFNLCPRRRNRYSAANTTISRMDDTTTVIVEPPGNIDTESPNLNNNQRHSTGSQTLGNGRLNTNSNLENSYEMSVTSGDTSTSPVNGTAKEELSPLLTAGNVIINENGRTLVHDNEENAKEHNKKGTDV